MTERVAKTLETVFMRRIDYGFNGVVELFNEIFDSPGRGLISIGMSKRFCVEKSFALTLKVFFQLFVRIEAGMVFQNLAEFLFVCVEQLPNVHALKRHDLGWNETLLSGWQQPTEPFSPIRRRLVIFEKLIGRVPAKYGKVELFSIGVKASDQLDNFLLRDVRRAAMVPVFEDVLAQFRRSTE